MGAALEQFWVIRGYYSEGRTFLERALAMYEGVATAFAGKGAQQLLGDWLSIRATLIAERCYASSTWHSAGSWEIQQASRFPSRD